MNDPASPESIGFARRREAQERAAAKRATTLAARRIHQQLAELYALLADGMPIDRIMASHNGATPESRR
jgi:hypothetical protein